MILGRGLFDLPAPLLAWLDDRLGAVLAPRPRLVLWAIVGAVLCMCLYRVLSPQGQIMRARQEAVEARRRLSAFGGEMREAWPLIRTALGRSLRHLGLVLRPALLASLPLISLLAWLSSAYGHAFPAPGEAVDVRAFPQPLACASGLRSRSGGTVHRGGRWPW